MDEGNVFVLCECLAGAVLGQELLERGETGQEGRFGIESGLGEFVEVIIFVVVEVAQKIVERITC